MSKTQRRANLHAQDGASSVFGRLLDIKKTSAYLNLSPSMIRAYVRDGVLHPVVLPNPLHSSGVMRRTLFDIRELDSFVDSCAGREDLHRRKQQAI